MSTPTVDELSAAVEDADALIAFLRTLDPDQGIDTIDQDNCFYCKYLADRFPAATSVRANCDRITVREGIVSASVPVDVDDFGYRVQSRWIGAGFDSNYRRGQTSVFLFPPEAIEIVETLVFEMGMEGNGG